MGAGVGRKAAAGYWTGVMACAASIAKAISVELGREEVALLRAEPLWGVYPSAAAVAAVAPVALARLTAAVWLPLPAALGASEVVAEDRIDDARLPTPHGLRLQLQAPLQGSAPLPPDCAPSTQASFCIKAEPTWLRLRRRETAGLVSSACVTGDTSAVGGADAVPLPQRCKVVAPSSTAFAAPCCWGAAGPPGPERAAAVCRLCCSDSAAASTAQA